jgi:hypothetical protein
MGDREVIIQFVEWLTVMLDDDRPKTLPARVADSVAGSAVEHLTVADTGPSTSGALAGTVTNLSKLINDEIGVATKVAEVFGRYTALRNALWKLEELQQGDRSGVNVPVGDEGRSAAVLGMEDFDDVFAPRGET